MTASPSAEPARVALEMVRVSLRVLREAEQPGARWSPSSVWGAIWAWTLARLAAASSQEVRPLAALGIGACPERDEAAPLFAVLARAAEARSPAGVAERSARAWNLGAVHAVLRTVSVARAPDDQWVVSLAPTRRCPSPRPIQQAEWEGRAESEQLALLAERTGRSGPGPRSWLRAGAEAALLASAWFGERTPAGALYSQPCGTNRELAAHYTPREVALEVAEAALAPLWSSPSGAPGSADLAVCDPAVGTGAFAWAMTMVLAEHLCDGRAGSADRQAALSRASRWVYGVDVDPRAVGVTRLLLWVLGGGSVTPSVTHRVRLGDALVGRSRQSSASERRLAGNGNHGTAAGVTRSNEGRSTQGLADSTSRRAEREGLEPLAHPAGQPVHPLHWEESFPEVFQAPRAGFDAVVTNPPYRSARSVDSAVRRRYRSVLRDLHPAFTRGAFDLSTVFWSRVVGTLLRPGGRYGMLVPTASLSSMAGWQEQVQAVAPPDGFILYPVDVFPEARVRTVAVTGGRSAASVLQIVDRDCTPIRRGTVEAEQLTMPWYAVTRLDRRGPDPRVPTVPLGALAGVRAGCATDAAYRLSAEVVSGPGERGLRLVTTGAIDRYRCHWGQRPIRFLGADYRTPRWPEQPFDPSVQRAAMAQSGAKVVVAGLTSVLECVPDPGGELGGVVSTWVVTPRPAAPELDLLVLSGVLNSATLSRIYMTLHGGAAMSGHQTTIKKRALLELPLPSVLAMRPERGDGELVLCPWASGVPVSHRLFALRWLVKELMQAGDGPRWDALDLLAHGAAAALYGLTRSEAEADLRWWQDRSRTVGAGVDWEDAVERALRG